MLNAPRIVSLRRELCGWLRERRVGSVISLMPHVWSPLVSGAIRAAGMRYAVIMHDAKPHPGDHARLIFNWLLADARAADTVVTLSGFVRNEFVGRAGFAAARVQTVFMPDIVFPGAPPHGPVKARRQPGTPLRVLCFGRLMQYKGLQLFVDAMEILAADKTPVEISVCGEGDLGGLSPRLAKLGAFVADRWLSDAEIGHLLTCHDAVVLTHQEASQSGVVSAALGAGLPVVTTPVGGLVEQVGARGVGLVAERVDAQAIADCVRRLACDAKLYDDIVARIGASVPFSMRAFLRELLAVTASGMETKAAPDLASSPAELALRASACPGAARAT